MRIITGKYRNKKLFMPRGIRPTQDKVRKAIFDILGDISGLSFLELFAGSGAVGLEALSNGASELVLVEYSRDCLDAIKRNINLLRAPSCTLFHLEAQKAIKLFAGQKKHFNIIFLDPPYYKEITARLPLARQVQDTARGFEPLAKKILQTLEAYDILSPNGLIVAQHFKREKLPETSPALGLIKQAKYGDTWLSFFQKKE